MKWEWIAGYFLVPQCQAKSVAPVALGAVGLSFQGARGHLLSTKTQNIQKFDMKSPCQLTSQLPFPPFSNFEHAMSKFSVA